MSRREALLVALDAEVKAHDFFAEALKLPVSEPVRKLFEELRQEEIHHQELVKRELDKLPPEPEVTTDDQADEPVAR
jgi:erythrin-vacuolar iron transport family protein